MSESVTDWLAGLKDGGSAADRLNHLLDSLADDELQRLAIDKLDGFTNREISERFGISLRSVERQLQLIRRIWKRESQP